MRSASLTFIFTLIFSAFLLLSSPAFTAHAQTYNCAYNPAFGSCGVSTACTGGTQPDPNCSNWNGQPATCPTITYTCIAPPGFNCMMGSGGMQCFVCSTPPCEYSGPNAQSDCTAACGTTGSTASSNDAYCGYVGVINTALGCIDTRTPTAFIEPFLRWAIGISAVIAIGVFVYAGVLIISSSGNPKQVKAGQELILAAVWGVVVIALSIVLLNFLGVNILNLQNIGFHI